MLAQTNRGDLVTSRPVGSGTPGGESALCLACRCLRIQKASQKASMAVAFRGMWRDLPFLVLGKASMRRCQWTCDQRSANSSEALMPEWRVRSNAGTCCGVRFAIARRRLDSSSREGKRTRPSILHFWPFQEVELRRILRTKVQPGLPDQGPWSGDVGRGRCGGTRKGWANFAVALPAVGGNGRRLNGGPHA